MPTQQRGTAKHIQAPFRIAAASAIRGSERSLRCTSRCHCWAAGWLERSAKLSSLTVLSLPILLSILHDLTAQSTSLKEQAMKVWFLGVLHAPLLRLLVPTFLMRS